MIRVGKDHACPMDISIYTLPKAAPAGTHLMKKRPHYAIDIKWDKTSCPELFHSATSMGLTMSLQTEMSSTSHTWKACKDPQ